jgi:hypothetical protein
MEHIHTPIEFQNIDMSKVEGRWKWLRLVTKDIDNLAMLEPPYQPRQLQNEYPSDIQKRKDVELIKLWNEWLDKSLKVRHDNTLRLRTLLRCYGIAREAMEAAPEGKKHIAEEVMDLLLAYLDTVWSMPKQQVMDAQVNVDDAAKKKAGIIASGYMDAEWCASTYRVVG